MAYQPYPTGLATNTVPGNMPAAARAGDQRTSTVFLTDANATIQPFTDSCSRYILPAGTLTANRVLTLGITSLANGFVCDIVILDTSAHTYTINNNAAAAIFTKSASQAATTCEAFTSAGDWIASIRWFTGT